MIEFPPNFCAEIYLICLNFPCPICPLQSGCECSVTRKQPIFLTRLHIPPPRFFSIVLIKYIFRIKENSKKKLRNKKTSNLFHTIAQSTTSIFLHRFDKIILIIITFMKSWWPLIAWLHLDNSSSQLVIVWSKLRVSLFLAFLASYFVWQITQLSGLFCLLQCFEGNWRDWQTFLACE